MKKLIIAVAVLMGSVTLTTSCGNTEACWDVAYTYSVLGVSQSAHVYVYGTKNDVDAKIEEIKNQVQEGDITFTRKKIDKSKSDCVGITL
ncbi:MAG: hypothetical protein IJS05_02860 [Paludibacteraceae bacterium]|nr:hypothetical protein [Paludibacteraceae bacterium]